MDNTARRLPVLLGALLATLSVSVPDLTARELIGAGSASSSTKMAGEPTQDKRSLFQLLKELNEARHAIAEVRKLADKLKEEVTRMAEVIRLEAGFFDTADKKDTVKYGNQEFIRARKKWVDFYMMQMRPLVDLMIEEVNDVEKVANTSVMDDRITDRLKPYFEEWKGKIEMVEEHLSDLNDLTKSPPYNQPAIAQSAECLRQDMAVLARIRRHMYDILKKDVRSGPDSRKGRTAG